MNVSVKQSCLFVLNSAETFEKTKSNEKLKTFETEEEKKTDDEIETTKTVRKKKREE